MFENLFTGFKKKYDDEIKNATQVEKEEEEKRKQKIEELQERIKVIQTDYEEAGKIKVEKFKENEMYNSSNIG
jgi:flagellar motility protein MotE (MotC chaperone)